LLKQHAFFGQTIHDRRLYLAIAITLQSVGSQRIHGNE